MPCSMTGFAKHTESTVFGVLDWEIRAVNHRFLEVFTRLPEPFRAIELDIRNVLQKHIKRGKVDVSLQFTPAVQQAGFEINTPLLHALSKAIATVKAEIPDAQVNALEILHWHQMTKSSVISLGNVQDVLLSSLEKAIMAFDVSREREGVALAVVMQASVLALCDETDKITARLATVMAAERKRILNKFAELSVSVDPTRLEQEMVWIMQKADIAEELARLQVHITEVRRVLRDEKIVGRRLDFLMQELNREVNTIASKSVDVETTQSTVEMKVQIEQLREQVQNLE